MSRMIKIFDTTLRDGEQSPGCSMNHKEKLELARQLEKMKVDVIEAGFAASSPGDFASVKAIADTIKDCSVATLARTTKDDIDKAWGALQGAVSPRIHIFLATSPIHMEYKLRMKPEYVKELAIEMVRYAKSFCPDVEFSAEDATRSELPFLYDIIGGVIEAGATAINLPDTVGYTVPDEHFEFIRQIRENTRGIDKVDLSVHCHNDLGLGVANSLAALKAGATQVECTINGIGERAGNAALEEIVMAINTRKDVLDFETRIETQEIMRTSHMLSSITGVKVQPNKAIVGENAFAHESGIHQHGVMQNKSTYEIMTPESIGLNSNKMVLGKHSGKHAFKKRLEEMGYTLSPEELGVAFAKFKVVADKKKQVFDKDLEAIIAKEIVQVPKVFTLNRYVINSGNTITATATMTVNKEERKVEKVARGDGPIDAAFKAVNKIVDRNLKLEDFQIQSITEGQDALGDALVKISNGDGVIHAGRGLSTDIIEASIYAYINAVNKMIYEESQNKEV